MASRDRETRPPEADGLEVSLFGPGVGECVVVHLGSGEWMIVDSCIDSRTRRPVAIDYLQSIGFDPAVCIKLVVVTHWHNDHMQGAAEILRQAPTANFFCSAALGSREYHELVAAASRHRIHVEEEHEFAKILTVLRQRNPSRVPVSGIGWARGEMRLLSRGATPECGAAEVWALSPSSDALSVAHLDFAKFLPQFRQPKKRPVALGPNRTSVVLWIELGEARALLGADLEESGVATMGWSAIVASSARPAGLAHVFKVPHHGSINAHYDRVWDQMLTPEPTAVLAPYLSGPKPLPSDADIERIKRKTGHAFITAPPRGFRTVRRDPAVERIIQRELRAVAGKMGHVRLRWGSANSGPLNVELFSPASRF